MAAFFFFLIWAGGADVAGPRLGSWRALIWPVYLGRYLAGMCIHTSERYDARPTTEGAE